MMPSAETTTQEPLRVSILAQGGHLIASIHTALDDTQLQRFERDLLDQIGQRRATGVVIDVGALDVVDSFASRTLRRIGEAARLRGATTVVVGIKPDVALAMVTLGLRLDPVHTALDLEEGIAHLQTEAPGRKSPDEPG
jgi:rsbT antagonist protein RsbS